MASYYEELVDEVGRGVATIIGTPDTVIRYQLQPARVLLFLITSEDMRVRMGAGHLKMRDLGYYVVLRPTSTAGYDPLVYPFEVEYTTGQEIKGDPMIVGTYSEEILDRVIGYVARYLTTGQHPNLEKTMIN